MRDEDPETKPTMDVRFTFVMTPLERQMLKEIAAHMERTESDAMRQLVRQAYANLPAAPTDEH
jgi:hypothetical protein